MILLRKFYSVSCQLRLCLINQMTEMQLRPIMRYYVKVFQKKVIKTGVKEAGKYDSTIADFVYDGLCEYEKHNLN